MHVEGLSCVVKLKDSEVMFVESCRVLVWRFSNFFLVPIIPLLGAMCSIPNIMCFQAAMRVLYVHLAFVCKLFVLVVPLL